MNETLHSCLVTSNHAQIPLQGVRLEACLTGLGSADGTLYAMVTFHPQPLGIPSRGNAVLRKIPIAITQGWHGRGSVFPSMAAVMRVDMALPASASSPPLEIEFQAMASAHNVTEPLRAARRRLAPALGVGEGALST